MRNREAVEVLAGQVVICATTLAEVLEEIRNGNISTAIQFRRDSSYAALAQAVTAVVAVGFPAFPDSFRTVGDVVKRAVVHGVKFHRRDVIRLLKSRMGKGVLVYTTWPLDERDPKSGASIITDCLMGRI